MDVCRASHDYADACPFAVICLGFNIYGEGFLPLMQSCFMPVYIAVCFATVGVMWGLCPHVSAKEALLDFQDAGGWNSMGLALMVGQISAVFALGGEL